MQRHSDLRGWSSSFGSGFTLRWIPWVVGFSIGPDQIMRPWVSIGGGSHNITLPRVIRFLFLLTIYFNVASICVCLPEPVEA